MYVKLTNFTEYSELELTHKVHRVQLLKSFSMEIESMTVVLLWN